MPAKQMTLEKVTPAHLHGALELSMRRPGVTQHKTSTAHHRTYALVNQALG